MKNKYYILEGRKHKPGRHIPNTTEHIIGIFTSPKYAEKWIKTEGKNFYPKHWKRFKYHFWALLSCESLNNNDTYLYRFYDLV